MKKQITILSLLIASFFSGVILNAKTDFFPDVPSNAWFHQYVSAIKDWGVISGNDDGTFAPQNNINRAEFSKMLYLYDKRVDEKIDQIPNASTSSSPTSKGFSTMYLQKFNQEPNECPSGWTQVGYGKNWEDGGRFSWERVCITTKNCDTIHLENYNAEADKCPSGWIEIDSGIKWSEGGRNKYHRVCSICH